MARRLVLGDDERAAAEARLERGFRRALRFVQRRVVAAVGDAATTLVAAGSEVADDDQIDVDTDDSEWGALPLTSSTASVNPAAVYDPAWWSTAYAAHVRRPLRGFFDESRQQTADLLDVKLQDDEPHTQEAWEHVDDEARNRWGAPLHGFVSGKVEDAVVGGSTVAGLMGSLRDENGGWFNENRAGLLAIAAIATVWNRSTLSTATAARAVGTSSTKTWITVGDDRVRPTHVEMDGVSIDVAEDFLVDGAYPAGGPHDERLPPEETANCRCVLSYVADGGDVVDDTASLSDAADGIAALAHEGEVLAEEGEVGLIDYESIQDNLPTGGGGSATSESAGDVEVDTHLADDVDEVTDLAAPPKRRKLTVLDLGRFADSGGTVPSTEVLHTHGHCKGCGAWLEGRRYCHKCGDGYDGPLLEAGTEAPPVDDPHNQGLSPDTITGTGDVGEVAADGVVNQEDDSAMTATTSHASTTSTRFSTGQMSDVGLGLAPWRGVVAVEGKPTGDGRMFRRGALYWDDTYLPADVFAMLRDPEGGSGHDGSEIAGRIDRMWKQESAAGYVEVWAEGVYDTSSDTGREVLRLQKQGMLTGVSVDVDAVEVVLPDIAEEDLLFELLFGGAGVEEYSAGRIRRVTVCSIPAFIEARIFPVDDAGSLVASAGDESFRGLRVWTPVEAGDVSDTLVASAAGWPTVVKAKDVDVFHSPTVDADPDVAVFARRDYTAYTPFTVDGDGVISGHASPWGQCHIGFSDRCVTAPRSTTGYAHARTGHVLTATGDLVPTARVFAQFGPGRRGHAPDELSAAPAVEWYESMCLAVADVAVYEDAHGIQLQGRVRPGTSRNQVVALRASRISPDWRTINGRLECVGFAVVNVSGFTNAPGAALVASAMGADVQVPVGELHGSAFIVDGEVRTLVASGGPGADVLSDALADLLGRVSELEQAEFRRQADALLSGLPSLEEEEAALAAEVEALLSGVDLTVPGPEPTTVDPVAALSDDERVIVERIARLLASNRVDLSGVVEAAAADTQTCPECGWENIPMDATECPHCGAALDGGGGPGSGGGSAGTADTASLSSVCACDGVCQCDAAAAVQGSDIS